MIYDIKLKTNLEYIINMKWKEVIAADNVLCALYTDKEIEEIGCVIETIVNELEKDNKEELSNLYYKIKRYVLKDTFKDFCVQLRLFERLFKARENCSRVNDYIEEGSEEIKILRVFTWLYEYNETGHDDLSYDCEYCLDTRLMCVYETMYIHCPNCNKE